MNKKEVIDSLRSLHDLSKAINSTLNVEEVVEMIEEKTASLMRTNRVLILLLDRTKKVLNLHSAFGFDEEEVPVKNFYNIKPFDHCIVHKGMVITMEEILPEDDYREYTASMPFLSDMVFAPLEIKGEAYGLLGISDRKRKYSAIELEIFCALGSQASVAIENASLYRRLKDTFIHTASALAEAINSRDPYTGGHTKRVEEYSLKIADALDFLEEEKENLKLAAILHDIGKIGIDDAILRKGGHLSGEEEVIMQKHPEIGARILSFADEMGDVMPGVCYHHEWYDGSGYPEGLEGEEIPIQARIIAIADAFDALTTNRPYRKGIDLAGALEELIEKGGSQFDPFLVEIFCKTMREGGEL